MKIKYSSYTDEFMCTQSGNSLTDSNEMASCLVQRLWLLFLQRTLRIDKLRAQVEWRFTRDSVRIHKILFELKYLCIFFQLLLRNSVEWLNFNKPTFQFIYFTSWFNFTLFLASGMTSKYVFSTSSSTYSSSDFLGIQNF